MNKKIINHVSHLYLAHYAVSKPGKTVRAWYSLSFLLKKLWRFMQSTFTYTYQEGIERTLVREGYFCIGADGQIERRANPSESTENEEIRNLIALSISLDEPIYDNWEVKE